MCAIAKWNLHVKNNKLFSWLFSLNPLPWLSKNKFIHYSNIPTNMCTVLTECPLIVFINRLSVHFHTSRITVHSECFVQKVQWTWPASIWPASIWPHVQVRLVDLSLTQPHGYRTSHLQLNFVNQFTGSHSVSTGEKTRLLSDIIICFVMTPWLVLAKSAVSCCGERGSVLRMCRQLVEQEYHRNYCLKCRIHRRGACFWNLSRNNKQQ